MFVVAALLFLACRVANDEPSTPSTGDTSGWADPCDTAAAASAKWSDADGDGFSRSEGDCDDCDPAVNPGSSEACNGIDDDCDDMADEDFTVYPDADFDGYGDPTHGTTLCVLQAGYVTNSEDCDDSDSSVSPDAAEACDGIDNNCDDAVDEACR